MTSILMAAAGTIGNDAELKFSAAGNHVLRFSVACNTGFDKQKNERKTTWVRCTMFGSRTEGLSALLTKGSKVSVYGTVNEVQAYMSKSGEPAASLEMNVNEVILQGGKPAAADPFD